MKQQITFKSLLVVICLLLNSNLQAQEVPHITINIATAGTLPSLIASTKKYQITNLTITGNLNGTDMLYIREMAGCDVDGKSTLGKLSVLDLSGANIVAGGSSYTTSLNKIGDDAFSGCTGLTSISIPNSVTSIVNGVFAGCTNLKEFIISKNHKTYKSVEGILFNKNCTELIAYPNAKSNIYIIPNSVTAIGFDAFYGCTGLTSITIPNSVTAIGSDTFFGCTGLTSITIPNSVTIIGTKAFKNCTELTSVTIPNSVTAIEFEAFSVCSKLTSITLGNRVTSIGNYAFYYCEKLTEIHCKALTPPAIGTKTFHGINNTTCKLYVPKGTYAIYWRTTGWGDFTNIIEE